MEAWQYESGTWRFDNETKNNVYINKNIEMFLDVKDHDHNLVLVGPKGVGKTLFLNLKSYSIREKYLNQGIKVYPERGQLCENIILDNKSIGKKDLLKFTEIDLWNKIWRLSISIVTCKTLGILIEDYSINGLISTGFSFTNILSNVLSNRSDLNKYLDYLPTLTRKIESVNTGVCIFLDNVDQAFSQFLTEEHYSDYEDLRLCPAVMVWTNAQVGLMSAIYDLNRHNSHIKVYTSIRAEAFKCISNQMTLNYKNYTTFLKYSKVELRKIFEKNIGLTPDDDKSKPNDSDIIKSFLGIKKIAHTIVKDKKNKPKKEDVFDYIYRHTMGRPREIVLMGNHFFLHMINDPEYKKLSENKKSQKIRTAVSTVSNLIIKTYLTEIIPRFDFNLLEEFIMFIQSNIIPAAHAKNNYPELLKHYFAIGIIGFAQRDVHSNKENRYVQKFLPASEYSYKKNIIIPNTKYFITHPCLDNYLKRTLDSKFYNPYNIIGKSYKFKEYPGMSNVYDVALSYSSNERSYVEEVAKCLIEKEIKVFYDKVDRGSLWGNNLEQYLQYVYRNSSKYCVIFLSKSYLEKKWTNLELKNAIKRYDSNNKMRYLLPIKFGEIETKELEDIVYLDAFTETPHEIADLIELNLQQDRVSSEV